MKWIYLLLLAIGFWSCKKNDVIQETVIDTPTLSLWGEFLLLDAKMYVDNHETGSKVVYQHFGPTHITSSLRFDGSLFDIENIVQGVTTYSFYKPAVVTSSGSFILNEDTTRIYGLSVNQGFNNITENPFATQPSELYMGGSARPFTYRTDDYDNKIAIIRIEEVEASINGQNCRYFTELKMKKIKEW